MGIGEKKSDRTVETKVRDDSPISQIEENGITLTIDSHEIPPIEENVNPFAIPIESDVDGIFYSRPCQQFDAIGDCSSKMVDTLCPYGEDVTIAVNSSSLLECSGEVYNGGRNADRVDCSSETKCPGLVASPVKENVCTLDISSVGVVEKSDVEEPDIGAVDTCSRVPDMPNISEEDLTVVFNSLECFGQIDNVGRDDMGVDSCPEVKCYGYGPSQILENICALNTDSFEITTESVDICSSRRLHVLDLSVANNSGNSVECSEAKWSSIVPSSSRRSSRVHKAIGKAQTKNITRKFQKTTKVPYPDKSMEFPFNNARKKRSCVSKPARSSIWGVLGNVNQVFAENSDLVFSEVQSQGLQKANGSHGNAKINKVHASENSKGSIKSSHASSRRIRLKVRLGNEVIQRCLNVMIPAVAHTSAPADGTTNEHRAESIFPTMPQFSNLINHVKDKMGSEGTEQHNSGDSSADCEGGTGEYGGEDLEVHLTVKNTDSSPILEKSVGVTAGCYLGITSADSGGGVNTGPGTSPDSEVINIVQDAEVGPRCQEGVHYSVLTSKRFSDLENVNCKRGNCIREDGSPGQEGINTAIPLNTCECGHKVGNGFDSRETTASFTTGDATISSEEYSTKPLPLSKEIEVEVYRNILKIEIDREDKTSCSVDIGLGLPESLDSKKLLLSTKIKGHKLSKCSKSGGGSKGRSKDSDSARSRKGNVSRKRENRRKLGNEIEATKNASDDAVCKVDGPPETGNNMVNDLGMINPIDGIGSVNMSYLGAVSSGYGNQILPQRKAWVCCDDCHKWRRIPAALADSLGENSRWICKDNMDKAFTDCSTPQEKSNAEINTELELPEASGGEDAPDGCKHFKDLECRPSKVRQPASFTCIPHNEYLHRSRKSQTIDEIMVCHCRPSFDGRMGCGDECLNRMLNIECVRGACPCGNLCSNQQFQKREYAGMHWFATGKKGYGLQLLDNVSKGQFLIEYIGEVLDINAYDARQKKYASDGHKHFYFMTLNGSEVIDASAKGNIGRFINHSCDPNCRTEKWMVNGEICIGLFALRDMKKGEEVTFDYNYVRVFGAAAKKCYCGSLQCQGYIGGDPSNTEVIVQGDSDEEFPEPVMLFEDGKRRVRLKNKIARTKLTQKEESLLKARNKIDEPTTDVVQLQITTQFDDSSNRAAPVVSKLHCSSLEKLSISGPEEVSAQTEDVTSSLISSVQEELPTEDDPLKKGASSPPTLDTSTTKLSKLLPDGIDANRKFKSETLTQRTSSKLGHHMKISRSSNSATKGKVNSDSLRASKSQVTPDRSELQQSIKTSANSFESVEVKLNELLDGDGGISKRKDAAKGYLKLLLLTAASGDSGNGEAIQSNRELSMILDALLKTKSRIALIDIINKNGLRMLHNIMKQYRRDFKKIPILRKLLKVLEYLAVREILTQEHINGGPPCPGMESFTESILSLTEHDDKQVHQIARSFRYKWIPRHLRRLGYMDRADGRDFLRGSSYKFSASPNVRHDPSPRPPQETECVKQATPVAAPVAFSVVQEGSSAECTGGSSLSTATKIRKRKSRWDQPADINKNTSGLLQSQSQQDQSSLCGDDERSDVHDDAPPGFSSCGSKSTSIYLPKAEVISLDCPKSVVGQQQERFISGKPISYGIPLSIVKQFGSLQAEFLESWTVAPGIPFYPFPPLPQNNKNGLDPMSTDQPGACAHPANPGSTPAMPGAKLEHPFKRERDPIDLGKRYFRQQKWSNPKIPPWLWQRNQSHNGRGLGNQIRNGVYSSDVGVGNEYINKYRSEDVNCSRVEKPGNDCYQPQQIQNHPHHY